ncbi:MULTISPECIES: membrane protein [unclassified Streptomyces]|uniref:membrane protein n=1 Tax=unclassified Streptomyces TaxID=2593676 RepID=UPI0004C048A9|nr:MULTISPECIES: membrane protein [unclassified Streptomyces]
MSRETDSPSSGPQGRGGAAYPSGTPPYGTPTAPGAGQDAGRSAKRPEDRKTETTLTTRIRINIPGSRPIPPVVVRKTVADADPADGEPEQAERTSPSLPAPPVPQAPAEPAQPAPPAEEKPTSDWFAPRKSAPGKGGQGGGSANGAGQQGGSGASGTVGGAGTGGAPVGGTRPGGGSGRPAGVVGGMSVTGGARTGSPNGAGLSGATGGPVAPGHGGGTGSFDVTEALAGPSTGGTRPAAPGTGEPRRDDLPYVSDDGRAPQDPFGGPQRPGGDGPGGPRGPGTGPVPRVPGAALSDDTAVLTPQKQAAAPPGAFGNPGNVSGDTLTSGVPFVPGDQNVSYQDLFPDEPAVGGPPKPPAPAEPAATPAKPAKKGRSKLALLGVGVFLVGGVAYGAGLLMNRSDVPKGTTVLGVDIGGGTRDDAVEKLDAAFGDHMAKPLKLAVDGQTVSLKPDQAGLQFDTQATASSAARSDYNPVSVIGSLFGNHRVVEPVMPVDEEKLQAALTSAAGGAGSMTEGSIRFESGKVVPVYGKAGKGIDVAGSAQAIERAYRAQVENGASDPVKVPTTTRQPTVPDAEVDRMVKEFAQPAMSGLVTVQSDAAHTIAFSPANSLWKFLGVKAQNGKLVEYYDQAALKELYGDTFDGVLINRATGEKTPVTVQDVISALRPALKSTDNRVGVIETDPS